MPRRDYSRITGSPRIVTLGGREYSVPQLCGSILGELEAWLRTVVINPCAEAKSVFREVPELAEDVQRDIWIAAVEASKDYPPRYDSARGQDLILNTHEGTARLLFALLRRTTPGVSLDDAGELADQLSGEEVTALLEAISPGELGDPKAPSAGGTESPELGYERARAYLAKEYGWTFAEIDEMGFDLIDSAMRGGKPEDGISVDTSEDVLEMQKHWRNFYQGL